MQSMKKSRAHHTMRLTAALNGARNKTAGETVPIPAQAEVRGMMRQVAASHTMSPLQAVEYKRSRQAAADVLAYLILVYLTRVAREGARRKRAPRH
jgi:hypothetical protein